MCCSLLYRSGHRERMADLASFQVPMLSLGAGVAEQPQRAGNERTNMALQHHHADMFSDMMNKMQMMMGQQINNGMQMNMVSCGSLIDALYFGLLLHGKVP